ncbi:MAG: helix-turn-helix transcriptional regulator [Castellaniella sp.]|uniref:helix-turn-helix domain-containing protein n=1 Tax=Castellaniella sp. TaxID=1955812 RepID=UPI002A35F3E6|nr:helix-turn-helix transcriptional regulator [Castellaniella sp.]MDY0309073.1 helix-turn-helix transcriptional regulator [Castellaniella sp.]
MKLLTEREHDCLYWAAQGKTSWEIGCILGISERTANFHIANSCEKLDVRTRQAAITAAMKLALLSPPRPTASTTTTRSRGNAADPAFSARRPRCAPPDPRARSRARRQCS